MNNVSQFCPGLFIFTFFQLCLFLSIWQSISPAYNAGGSRQNSRNSSAFFGNIDPLNTTFDLSAFFESTESEIDAAANAFLTTPIAGDEFSDAEDYAKNENEDDDLDLGNEGAGDEFSDADDYAKNENEDDDLDLGNEGSDVEDYNAKNENEDDDLDLDDKVSDVEDYANNKNEDVAGANDCIKEWQLN